MDPAFPLNIPVKLNNLDNKREKPSSLPPGYQPTFVDICSGRGKTYATHEGNLWFRSLIRENAEMYEKGATKSAKTKVVVGLVKKVRSMGGMFLKQDNRLNWYGAYVVLPCLCSIGIGLTFLAKDMGDKEARDKVGHAFRDYIGKRKTPSPGPAAGIEDRRCRSVGTTSKPGSLEEAVAIKDDNAVDETSAVKLKRSASAPIILSSSPAALKDQKPSGTLKVKTKDPRRL